MKTNEVLKRPQINSVIYLQSWSELALIQLTTTRMNLLTNGIILFKAEKDHSNKSARDKKKKLDVTNHEFKEDSLFLLSGLFSNY